MGPANTHWGEQPDRLSRGLNMAIFTAGLGYLVPSPSSLPLINEKRAPASLLKDLDEINPARCVRGLELLAGSDNVN